MKSLNFFLFVSVFFCFGATGSEFAKFCNEEGQFKRLVSPWTYSPDKGMCLEIECADVDQSITRERCFKGGSASNVIELHIKDGISRDESFSFHNTYSEVVLAEGETCFNECMPEKTTVIGIEVGVEQGLERKSCRQCFSKRTDLSREGTITIPSVGVKLYSGMKCYNLCQFEKNDYQVKPVYPVECQKCVGFNGQDGEEFEYLLNKEGRCYEVDSQKKLRVVPKHLCEGHNEEAPILTKYVKDSEFSIQGFLFNSLQPCVEIDEKTTGSIYKGSADLSNCETESIDNSSRNANKNDLIDSEVNS
ncbi:MAG: hypothetical protein KC478_11070, partial [Bacteriovoracaceae bacterium]|nr:hypothetical protein [Bacteriovoracaceae bacterium]